jgi:hypothetical protein
VARDDGTLRERYLAAIEGEIIAARLRLARVHERIGDHVSDRERDATAVAKEALASLEAERDQIRAGALFDEQDAEAFLAGRHRDRTRPAVTFCPSGLS